jgi:hypothetical protein
MDDASMEGLRGGSKIRAGIADLSPIIRLAPNPERLLHPWFHVVRRKRKIWLSNTGKSNGISHYAYNYPIEKHKSRQESLGDVSLLSSVL